MAERDTRLYGEDLYELHAHLIENYDVKYDNVSRRDRGLDPYEPPESYNETNLGPYMELVEEPPEEHERHQLEEAMAAGLNETDTEEEEAYVPEYHIKFKHIPTIWDHNYTRFLYYENISLYLNGYSRVVKYQITSQDYHGNYNPLVKSKLNRL